MRNRMLAGTTDALLEAGVALVGLAALTVSAYAIVGGTFAGGLGAPLDVLAALLGVR